MQVDRRSFLRYCVQSAAGIGLSASVLGRLEYAFAQSGEGLPTVIWLAGANCTGCTVSLANRIGADAPIDAADLLINHINLAYHPNLMGAAGSLAVDVLKAATAKPYVLAVEGGIPTAFGGHACMLYTDGTREVTAMEAVRTLAPGALATLSVGTCAGFGGIPSGNPNPTDIVSVSELTGLQTINIAGCPTHPDWIVWTIAQLLAGNMPRIGEDGRPRDLFYGDANNVHKNCPRKERTKAIYFGIDNACLKELGCKGPETQADCPSRKWNNGANWCIGANAQCLACTERGFPDKFSPLYNPTASLPSGSLSIGKAEWRSENLELRVEGKSIARKIVILKNAYAGTTLGSITADGEGKWIFRAVDPKPVPTRVRAESEGKAAERDVLGAPIVVAVTQAEYSYGTLLLSTGGTGSAGHVVALTDAQSGRALGSQTVPANGMWALQIQALDPVPSRVRATIEGVYDEKDVSMLGSPPVQLSILRAEYSTTRRLRVDGRGPAGKTVTVKDAASSTTYGTTVVAADNRWRFDKSQPMPIPNRVRAECSGQSIESNVLQRTRKAAVRTIGRI